MFEDLIKNAPLELVIILQANYNVYCLINLLGQTI